MGTEPRTPSPARCGAVVELATIDDYLGSARRHFFGSGYRRSTYQVRPVATGSDADLAAAVDVIYPRDWSSKGADSELRPHLSTVDVMVLGVRSAEALLASLVGLTPDDLQVAMIQKLVVRAGTRPEEALDGLPLRASLKKTTPLLEGASRGAESTIAVRVGAMRARLVLRHPVPGAVAAGDVDYALLGEDPARHWGSGYRDDAQSVRAVEADVESLVARAGVGLCHSSTCGTRASHAPGPATFIDAFVSLLQLGQVLAYELDHIERARSDTLWMQRLTLGPSPAARSQAVASTTEASAEVRIADHQLLDLPTGSWRNLDFRGESGGITMAATFAHRVRLREEDES